MSKLKDPNKINSIYNATMHLVLNKGFSGLTMAQVARQAGIATGTLYLYFENKEDLLDKLYLHIKLKKAQATLPASLDSQSFYSTFKQLWHSYFQYCIAQPQELEFISQFCDSGYISVTTKQETETVMKPLIDLFEQAQKDMVIVELPIMALLSLIYGGLHALAKYHISGSIPTSLDDMQAYFTMAWNSIRK